jgi:hypothetical protein
MMSLQLSSSYCYYWWDCDWESEGSGGLGRDGCCLADFDDAAKEEDFKALLLP